MFDPYFETHDMDNDHGGQTVCEAGVVGCAMRVYSLYANHAVQIDGWAIGRSRGGVVHRQR